MSTTKKRYVMHNQKCYACGKPQGSLFLGYDPHTLKSYCLKNCRNAKEIPEVDLIPMDNDSLLASIQKNYSGYTEEMITSLLGKTASVRLQPAHIMHLMKVANLEGYDKIQATLVNIIENDMKERNLDYLDLTDTSERVPVVEEEEEELEPENDYDYEESPEEVEQPEPVKLKTEKKTVVVNKKEEKPEVEEDGEDEFTF